MGTMLYRLMAYKVHLRTYFVITLNCESEAYPIWYFVSNTFNFKFCDMGIVKYLHISMTHWNA